MSLLTRDKLLSAYQRARGFSQRSASTILEQYTAEQSSSNQIFDVFLSHSYSDAEIVLGAKQIFNDHGLAVYVDWINDKNLDRSNVTARTANILRQRMKQCKSLSYLYTLNSTSSKWMSWELGFFDGYKDKVCILPITNISQNSFQGSEFLGLYPYVTEIVTYHEGKVLLVNNPTYGSEKYKNWLSSSNSLKPTS